MAESYDDDAYDVGVLVHFPDAVSDQVKVDLIELAGRWHGYSDGSWPYPVALLPVGDFLVFIFGDPDNANLFISHAEKYLQSMSDSVDVEQLYTFVMCWSGRSTP